MNKDIININDKGQYHGYVEQYHNGKLNHRGNWKNGNRIAYTERHITGYTQYYII